MGYDVWLQVECDIPAEKIPAAAKALWDAVIEKYPEVAEEWPEYYDEPHYVDAEDIHDVFDSYAEWASCSEMEDGSVSFDQPDDSIRHEEEDEWLFRALGPYITGTIYFQGQDHYQWCWEFGEKGLQEVGSEVLYGKDAEAPATIQKIVDIIYPEGKPVTAQFLKPHQWEQLVVQIEEAIRKDGFGPHAGMNELERLAEVVE